MVVVVMFELSLVEFENFDKSVNASMTDECFDEGVAVFVKSVGKPLTQDFWSQTAVAVLPGISNVAVET